VMEIVEREDAAIALPPEALRPGGAQAASYLPR